MNKSDQINELAAALVMAQPEFETATKDALNPHFKKKYADLSAVWDAVHAGLKKHALTVSQFPDHVEGAPALTTILIHKSGQWISGTYPLMVTERETTPQGYASAITYARRYGLSAVLGVVADEDDDGNAASRKKPAEDASPVSQSSRAPSKPAPDAIDALKAQGKEAAEGGSAPLYGWWKRLTKDQQTLLVAFKDQTLKPMAEAADKVPA